MKRLLTFIFIALSVHSYAQTPNQIIPFSHQYYQKLNTVVYDTASKFHSSIKGYYADDSLVYTKNSALMNYRLNEHVKRKWIIRKIFEEHLIEEKQLGYTFFLDFLPDFQVGYDTKDSKNTWLNTRGIQAGLNVGSKFSFYTSIYENQGVFPTYLTNYIQKNEVVPGQTTIDTSTRVKDWNYATALLSYTPSKHLNVTLGYDKNFIGDGYRSLLLSDVSANYSFLRVRANVGSVQYQTIFAYMLDPGAPQLTNDRRLGYRGKWSAMHYLDWNVSKRFSAGFFQAVTWSDVEPEGKRGFDFNYIHPFIFLRSVERANYLSSPDKMRLGFNLKYELLAKTAVYGQFMFDEFVAREFFKSNGFWTNKWALQFGFKGSDLFRVSNLNYLAEFNTARPYTYAHFTRLSNYSNYNQPLAHPLGANFKEILILLNYGVKQFDFQAQFSHANYGLDEPGTNYGQNIFKSYFDRVSDYGNKIGQGISTNLYFGEIKAAYLLNPKYNLRIELGTVLRQETNRMQTNSTAWFTFGVRSSFRNLYNDI
ncbi:MAG: gliding motility protein RemB [Bacteroidota bacterium]